MTHEDRYQWVWVFNGSGMRKPYNYPSGVFTSRERAEAWIKQHACSGVLTRYPVDIGVYDWAVAEEYFTPSQPRHISASFIETFSDASQEHYHI